MRSGAFRHRDRTWRSSSHPPTLLILLRLSFAAERPRSSKASSPIAEAMPEATAWWRTRAGPFWVGAGSWALARQGTQIALIRVASTGPRPG